LDGISFRPKEDLKLTIKKHMINLTDEEKQTLLDMTWKDTGKARKLKQAIIMLKVHEGLIDPQITSILGVG